MDRGRTGQFIVYQVKYSKKPNPDGDPRVWLKNAIKKEAHKVHKLIERGAREYVVMTNVAGTGHLDAGSIDVLDEFLRTEFSIPVTCLWRDDVNRRLDNAWSLKWSYPELLTGSDFLGAFVELGLSDQQTRRTNAIRAFVTHQYDADRQVRFQQVELESPLLDLFIDVPLAGRFGSESSADRRHVRRRRHAYASIARDRAREAGLAKGAKSQEMPDEWMLVGGELDHDDTALARLSAEVGAASFLLHPRAGEFFPRLVLEGAPGQGKW